MPSEAVRSDTLLAAVQALGLELGTVRAQGGAEFSARLADAEDELAAIHDEIRQQQQDIEALLNGADSGRAAMMRRFLSALPLATVLTSASGRILEANPAAHAMLRVPVGGLTGKPIFAFVAAGDRRRLRSTLSRTAVADDDEPAQTSATVAPRHGPVLPCRFALARDLSPAADQAVNDPAGEDQPIEDGIDGGADQSADQPPAPRSTAAVFWVIVPDYDEIEGPPSHQQLEALTRLCQLGADGSDLRTTLGAVVRLCRQAMTEVSDVSLLVGNPLEPSLALTSSAAAQHFDGLQHVRATGPVFEAYRSRRPVALDGAAVTENRGLSNDVRASAVRSLLAVPLLVQDLPTGVLTLYATGERSTATLLALRQAMPFVEASQSLIRDTNAYEELLRTQQQLSAALTSRAVIDQAKGMIMATLQCSADEAFSHLVRMSSTRHEKVRDVAQTMVDDVLTNRLALRASPSE